MSSTNATVIREEYRQWTSVAVPGIAAVALGLMVAEQPFVAIAAVLALALALAVLVAPDVVTLLVVFLFFTNAAGVAVKLHGMPPVVGLVLVLVLVIPLAHHLSAGRAIVATPALALVLLFLVAQLLATLFSIDIHRSWENVKTFIVEGVLLYFFLTNVIRTPETLRRAIWVVIAAGAFLGGLSLVQEVTGTYTRPYGGFAQVPRDFLAGYADKPRLSGPLGDPNYYAQILLPVVVLGLFMLWSERARLLRFLALASVSLAVAGILLSFSRGAGLAFMVVFALMAVLRAVRPRYVVLVAVGLVVALTAVPQYKERVSTLGSVGDATSAGGSDTAADESVRSRMTEMLAAALVYRDHPLVGVGPGGFPLYYQDYAERIGIEVRERVKVGVRRGEEPQRESHNMFLSIAAELGSLGLLLFGAILVVTIRELLRARRRWLRVRDDYVNFATALMLAIVAYVTSGFFLTLAFERYFWLLLGLAGAAAHVLRTVPADEAPEVAQPVGGASGGRARTRPRRHARFDAMRPDARGPAERRTSRVAVSDVEVDVRRAVREATREAAGDATRRPQPARGGVEPSPHRGGSDREELDGLTEFPVPPITGPFPGAAEPHPTDDRQHVRYLALAALVLALVLFGVLLVAPETLLRGF